VRTALAAPDLRQEDVAFRAQAGQLLLEGPHPLANLAHPALDVAGVDRAQVFRHKRRR
jgi:hypothetical protein